MTGATRSAALLAVCLAPLTCGPPVVSRARIATAPSGLGLALVEVAASAPTPPAWLDEAGVPVDEGVAFVGHGFGASAAQARQDALRDLYANVAMFAGVEIEVTALDTAHDMGGGRDDAFEERVTLSSRVLGLQVVPSEAYWVRYASPLLGAAGGGARFSHAVRAVVPSEVISSARAARRARRVAVGGRRLTVVLPFVETSSAGLGAWMQVELTARLAAQGAQVADPDEVREVLAGVEQAESLRLSRVEDAFAPDVVVSGLVETFDDEVVVALVRHDLAAGASTSLGVVRGALGARLARAVVEAVVGAAPPSSPSVSLSEEVEQAKLRSERALVQGDLEAASVAIEAALALEPSAQVFLRAGRILDRRGRFARPEPASLGSAASIAPPIICTDQGRVAAKAARARLAALERSVRRPDGPRWWDASTPSLGAVLRPVLDEVEGWATCGAGAVRCVDTCVPEGRPCPDVVLDGRLEAEWKRLYGLEVRLRSGAVLRQGPAPGHAAMARSEGAPARLSRVGELGHWLMVEGASRGWVRRTEVEILRAPVAWSAGGSAAPRTSVEAYAKAFARAGADQDRRTQVVALLGLATAAMRAESLGAARRLFVVAQAWADRAQDRDLSSRARFGLGRVLRRLERRDEARAALQEALRLRQALSGRARELEIWVALGGLALEQGRSRDAEGALGRAFRIARQLSNPQLEVGVGNALGVLALARGARAPAHRRFAQALETLRDLGELEGTLVAATNLAWLEAAAADPGVAAGLRDEAWRAAEGHARWRWLAELSLHRGLQAPESSEAQEELHLAALIFARLGHSASALRVQDALLVRELELGSKVAECVAEASWRLGAPVFEAPDGARPELTLAQISPGDVEPEALNLATNAAAALVLHAWTPARGRAPMARTRDGLVLTDPLRPPEVVPGTEDVRIIVLEAGAAGHGDGRPAAPPRPIPYRARVGYDRVLETLAVTPSAHFALTPRRLEESLGGWRGPRARQVTRARSELAAARAHARAVGRAELEAYATLNLAALDWFAWAPERAYTNLEAARRVFARLEDARGLAWCEEWQGYMMQQSAAPERAARHLSQARALFEALGDPRGVERVLSYGE